VISTDSDLYKNLVDAIGNASDPGQKFQVDSYKPAFFNVKARVLVDSRHTPAFVIAAVETALKDAFSFEKRTFGQPVTTADIVSVIQNVPGVAATDLDQFYRYQDSVPIPEPHEQIIPVYWIQIDLNGIKRTKISGRQSFCSSIRSGSHWRR